MGSSGAGRSMSPSHKPITLTHGRWTTPKETFSILMRCEREAPTELLVENTV